MGADRPPAPSRGTRSVCAFSCRLCPECVEADGHPDGSQLGGSSAQRPARLGPVICPWRWGPAAAPRVRAGVRFGAAAPRFECRVFAPCTACNVDVHVKKKKKKHKNLLSVSTTAASLATSGHGAPSGKAQRHVPERQDFVRALASGLNGSLSAGLRQTGRSGWRGWGRTAWFPREALAAWPRIARPSACPVAEGRGCEARKAWSAFAGQSQSQNWDPAWRASRFPERPAPACPWQRTPPAASASTPPHRSP